MAIDFPNSPAVNDTFVVGTTTWKYDGTKWNIVDTVSTTTAFAPIGTVANYMGSNPPTGWILCDGSSKLRSSYPSLFAVISTTFGQGSSPGTSFALPSFVGTTGIFIIRATDEAVTLTTASNLLAVPVGTMQQFLSSANIPTGWLRADGSAYSRTSYADLFALLCTTYTGATTASSSTTVSGLTGMSAGTHTGWGIAGSGIPSGAYISSVTNSTTVVISANATSNQSGIATLVIGPYGFTGADNTTTFNLPNIVGSGSGSPLYYIKAILSGDVEPSTTAHASNHIRAGSDIVDGDRLQVDYVPSYYTSDSSDVNAGATTDLTAHLKGIDNALVFATNAQTASYSLLLADRNKIVEISSASANTLTVPLNSSIPFPIGTQITILQTGAGQTTITATGGVTINATPGLKLRAQWSSASLIKRATNTWVAIGDLSA
jgi:microcystin-dependent protein